MFMGICFNDDEVCPQLSCPLEGGGQGKEEEEAGGQRKEGPTETSTPGADAPMGPTRSGMLNARNRRNHGRWCGVLSHRRGRAV